MIKKFGNNDEWHLDITFTPFHWMFGLGAGFMDGDFSIQAALGPFHFDLWRW